MIKKSTVIKLAATAGLMTGFAITTQQSSSNIFTPQVVQAAHKYKIKLTHNAYTYNYRGKRRGKRVLKKGKIYTAYRTKKIGHKNYYYLGKHNYINARNAKKYKNSTFKVKINYLDLDAGVVYKKPNKQKTSLTLQNTVKVYGEKKDANGTVWYQVGRNEWINSYGTNKPKGTKVSHKGSSQTIRKIGKTTSKQKENNKQNNAVKNKVNSRQSFKNITTQAFAQKIASSFITQLNNLRISKGLRPVETESSLQNFANTRSQELLQSFTHERPNGQSFNYYEEIAEDYATKNSTPEEIAKHVLDQFIYHDADSNNLHKRDLLYSGAKTIGCAVAWEKRPGLSWMNYTYPDYQGLRLVVDLND